MAWQPKVTEQLTAVTDGEQFFTAFTTLTKEIVHCQIVVDFPPTPVDDLVISVYTTLDDAAEIWDIQPIALYSLVSPVDPNALSFSLIGHYRYRIGVKLDGPTDVVDSIDLNYRKDGAVA